MSVPAPFGSIAELLERSLSIRHVYGEPVHRGDTTVIPVAQAAFVFGGGGGEAPRRAPKGSDESPSVQELRSQAQGAGGGGGVRLTPAGALEIGPKGTRFIRFHSLTPWLCGGTIGLAAGWLVARRRRP